MSYKTIVVHMQYGQSNDAVLLAAKQIHNHMPVKIIGTMAEQQTQMIYGKGYATLDYFDREQTHLEEKIAAQEQIFQAAFKEITQSIEWRSKVSMEPATNFIMAQACSADLIITCLAPTDFYEGPNIAHAGEIVMQAGRPVLAIPINQTQFEFENILVGWKDTREARRAIVDALPFLQMAKKITVLEIARKDDEVAAGKRLQEIIIWLKSHHINADPLVAIANDADAIQFIDIAQDIKPDLVVIGAYGHSRFREWVLGGVTNELLQCRQFCLCLSH